MATTKPPPDFLKYLERQLDLLRKRRFENLDVETVVDELESVVGKYRSEVRRWAENLIPILMRAYDVYGDWNDLQFERDMLLSALEDSPSLARTAKQFIKRAFEMARVTAELHGEPGCPEEWPKTCPWKALAHLLAAVESRNAEFLALERAGDADFGNCRRRERRRRHPR